VPVPDSDEPEYEVERVIAKRLSRNSVEYLVQWKGYSTADCTWEPAANLSNAPQKVQEFKR
jgi:hypothetical protein